MSTNRLLVVAAEVEKFKNEKSEDRPKIRTAIHLQKRSNELISKVLLFWHRQIEGIKFKPLSF